MVKYLYFLRRMPDISKQNSFISVWFCKMMIKFSEKMMRGEGTGATDWEDFLRTCRPRRDPLRLRNKRNTPFLFVRLLRARLLKIVQKETGSLSFMDERTEAVLDTVNSRKTLTLLFCVRPGSFPNRTLFPFFVFYIQYIIYFYNII